MSKKDTVFLLRECSAGIRTAVACIDGVMPYVKEQTMMQLLKNSKHSHESLGESVDIELKKLGSEGKDPNIMAKGMSAIKINAELAFKPTEAQAASLITDGCGMGIKSINKYMNQYPAAAPEVMNLANRISTLEAKLEDQMKPFL
jgi:hypothetical protein